MFISIIPYRTTGAAWVTILEVGPLSGHDSNHVADIQRVYWRQLARRQRYNVWWCCIVLVLFSKRVKWNQMGFALLVLTTAVLKWRVFKIDFPLHRINSHAVHPVAQGAINEIRPEAAGQQCKFVDVQGVRYIISSAKIGFQCFFTEPCQTIPKHIYYTTGGRS